MFTIGNAAVGYHCVANMTNIRHYGMSRTKIRSIKSKFTLDEMILKAEIFLGKLFNTGNYSIVCSSSFLSFRSQGKYNFTLKNMNAKWIIKGKLERVEGEDYMKFHQFIIDPEVSDFAINFSDELISKPSKLSTRLKLFKNKSFFSRTCCGKCSEQVLARFLQRSFRINLLAMAAMAPGPNEPNLCSNSFSKVDYKRLVSRNTCVPSAYGASKNVCILFALLTLRR